MSQILMLASNFPIEQERYFLERSIGATSNANNSFQWAIINGLQENGEVIDIITVPNIGAYPVRFKQLGIPRFTFDLIGGGKGVSISWLNLLFLKHSSIFRNLKKELENLDLSKYKYIIVYDLYPPFFDLLKDLKRKNPCIKIVVVVPDIIGMTRGKSNTLLKLFDEMSINKVQQGITFLDGIIYLTKYMFERMPNTALEKPSIVVEGICNPDILRVKTDNKVDQHKYLLYSGSLDVRHGVVNLIEAFKQLKREDLELWICGDGDGREIVQEECASNSLIKYLGQKPRKEVISLQSKAFLLVNPRTSEGEFTKYSFPSKIIEYFLSGRPTFMYKLPGIPEEYFDYCFTSDVEDVENLTESLEKIANIDPSEMVKKGKQAKDFILSNKSSKTQAKRIIDFFEGL